MTYKPDGYTDLAPYLIVADPDACLDFAVAAFGAERLRRITRPDGTVMHAEARIGDTVLMVGGSDGRSAAHLHLYLADPDAAFDGALAAGGTAVQAVADQDDGDRRGGVRAPCGTTWWLACQRTP
ncbi:VOC family protein [Rhodobacteraceae bacterium CCMM004]|nr:VOC family protein [Rhodobacteraceae bacterium CCMM004]